MSSTINERLAVVDALRAVAATAVAVFHFTNGAPEFIGDWAIARWCMVGAHGVDVFFVISGFVIPWAMAVGGFHWRDAGRFLAKRIVRLDPPFFATIVLALVASWASSQMPFYRGRPWALDVPLVLMHVGYLSAILGHGWIVPAFWTLAIEFQFYLSMILLFPLLARRESIGRFVSYAIAWAAGAACIGGSDPGHVWLAGYLPWFAAGWATFQYRRGECSRATYLALVTVSCALVTAESQLLQGALVAATALLIAFARSAPAAMARFGALSYSLYLVHEPIGGRVVNLALRHAGREWWFVCGVFLLAMTTSIVAAWLLYRLVERPARDWAAAIHYAPRSPSTLGASS